MCWLHTDLKGRLGNTLDALISTLVFENVTRCQITAWTDNRNYQSLLRQLVGTAHEYKIAPSTHASACRPSVFIETCPNITLSKDGSKYFDGRNMRIQSCMQFRTPGMNQYAFLKEYSAIAKSLRHTLPCYAGCKKGMHIRSGDGHVGSHSWMQIPYKELLAFAPPDIDFIAADLPRTKEWASRNFPGAHISSQDAIGDHCSLSKCKSIHAWTFSSFSFTASVIGNSSYVLKKCSRAYDGKCHLYMPESDGQVYRRTMYQ
jgi:hypothetical protein